MTDRERLEKYRQNMLAHVLLKRNPEQKFEISPENKLIKYNHDEEHVLIPEGITDIDEYAFACSHMKSVVIPEGVIKIGQCAFANCLELEKITLPTTIEWADSGAFSNCVSLKEVICFDMHFCLREISDTCNINDIFRVIIQRIHTKFIDRDRSGNWEKLTEHLLSWYFQENNTAVRNYLMQHCSEYFLYLIQKKKTHWVQKFLDTDIFTQDFSSKKEIDSCIQFANAMQAYEIQILLMNYRHQHFGDEDIAEKLKL
ncbi:MAG: leucine-rich repeat domain-containing protein [Oscillospiraceae bacterium]|nr:leucine-rich repeat domain-containing protein [Oscillospiraceae bacterium]